MFHLHLSSRGYCLRAFASHIYRCTKRRHNRARKKRWANNATNELFAFFRFHIFIWASATIFSFIESTRLHASGTTNEKNMHTNQKKNMRYDSWSYRVVDGHLMQMWIIWHCSDCWWKMLTNWRHFLWFRGIDKTAFGHGSSTANSTHSVRVKKKLRRKNAKNQYEKWIDDVFHLQVTEV